MAASRAGCTGVRVLCVCLWGSGGGGGRKRGVGGCDRLTECVCARTTYTETHARLPYLQLRWREGLRLVVVARDDRAVRNSELQLLGGEVLFMCVYVCVCVCLSVLGDTVIRLMLT